MKNLIVTLALKGIDVDFEVSGYMEASGSNSYGSDEPYSEELKIDEITHEGKQVSDKIHDMIMAKYEEYLADRMQYA